MVSRLYYPHALHVGQSVELSKAHNHRLRKVMRLQCGDPVVLFDGMGVGYHAILSEGSVCEVARLETQKMVHNGHVTLAFGVCQSHKIEWILQKATELGVDALQPLATERSASNHATKRYAARHSRYQSVLAQACEQSGRFHMPILHPMASIKQVLDQMILVDTTVALMQKGGSRSLPVWHDQRIGLFVGPEGGFTPQESAMLLKHPGSLGVDLGPYTLRCETACVASLAIIMQHIT